MADKKVNLGKKDNVSVTIFLDISNPNSPTVLELYEEEKLDKTKLPENIIEVKSEWARPNWTLDNIIAMNQYSDKVVRGKIQRIFDANALVQSRIRVLLKSWSLTDLDESFKLSFAKSIDNSKYQILDDATMQKIGEIDPPAILNAMYNRAVKVIYPEEEKWVKKAQEMLAEAET